MAETIHAEYDTHAAVRRLSDAGFTEPQAEALVSGHVGHVRPGLAAKSGIREILHLLKASEERMKASEERILARIGASEELVLAMLKANEGRMKTNEGRMKASEGRVREEVKDAKIDLLKRGVPVGLGMVAVFAAIVKPF